MVSEGDIQLLLQAQVSAKLHVIPSFLRLQPYIWTSDYMSININTLVSAHLEELPPSGVSVQGCLHI